MAENKKLSRREALRVLGAAGATGAAMIGFQNCANNADFSNAPQGSGGNCDPNATPVPTPPPPGNPPACENGGNFLNGIAVKTPVPGDIHNMQVRLFNPTYFDHVTQSVRTQCLLEVQIGANPSGGGFHPINFTNIRDIHAITDIFVIDRDNCNFLLWRRFSNADREPSTMFMISDQLVARNARLKVIASCSKDGFYGFDLTLGTYPITDYSTVVAAYNPAAPFGTSNLKYPYIARSATGGQGDIGAIHAPLVTSLNTQSVTALLGGNTAPHPRIAENHYVNGGAIFDQHGHLLTEPALIRYSDAGTASATPPVTFSNLNLTARGVTSLRISIFDTFNGYLMGFLKTIS